MAVGLTLFLVGLSFPWVFGIVASMLLESEVLRHEHDSTRSLLERCVGATNASRGLQDTKVPRPGSLPSWIDAGPHFRSPKNLHSCRTLAGSRRNLSKWISWPSNAARVCWIPLSAWLRGFLEDSSGGRMIFE